MKRPAIYIIPYILVAYAVSTCINPFAPGELDGDPFGSLLGDPTSIEGFYSRFQNAYEIRDTTMYGELIHSDFIFTFRDQDRNVDVSWGRSEELSSTYNLFNQSIDIQLRWNNFISRLTNEDETRSQVVRRFELSVAVRGNETLRTDGSASFLLVRSDSSESWQLLNWRDESDI
ncbi:MAG: hypothetical protein WD267_08845 [Balneolales bacterium]